MRGGQAYRKTVRLGGRGLRSGRHSGSGSSGRYATSVHRGRGISARIGQGRGGAGDRWVMIGAAEAKRPVAKSKRFEVIRNRPLLTLALGHMTVDMYIGLLPMMYPLLAGKFALDLKTVGLVSLAYGAGSSLSQPLFGWLADRHGTRYIGFALSWTAITFALLGFVPSFGVLVALAALS